MKGATPTATVCSAWPAFRLSSCTALPREEQTHNSSAEGRAMPAGGAAPPTFGGDRGSPGRPARPAAACRLPPGEADVVLRVADVDAVALDEQADDAQAERGVVGLAVGGDRFLHGGDGVERPRRVTGQVQGVLDLAGGHVEEDQALH